MSRWQIYTDRKTLPMMCGIYVMYRDGQVIYVGVSKDVRKRFTKHSITDWEYIKVKPATSFGAAHDLEEKLIKKLHPTLNSQGSSRSMLSSRHRVTIADGTFFKFRAFFVERNLKMKDMLNEIIVQFLKGVHDAEREQKEGKQFRA